MRVFCEKSGADFSSMRFMFDGDRIRSEQTPEEVFNLLSVLSSFFFPNKKLGLTNDDEIDAVLGQTGGKDTR